MALYIPRGYVMTDAEKEAWVMKVNAWTQHFHSGAAERFPFEPAAYQKFRDQFDVSPFVTDMWSDFLKHAESLYLAERRDLLQDSKIQFAMSLSAGGKWQNVELPYLEGHWSRDELKRLLREDHFLTPSITSDEYWCSETVVNHLTHLTEFSLRTGVSVARTFKSVVEFGGGSGSMARLLRRLRPDLTHVTIDLPIFLFIQMYFLKNIFGSDAVNLVGRDSSEIQPHKINLVAIGNNRILDALSSMRPDLFVATWSLSEANQFTQDYVRERDYFGSGHTLIGYRHYEGTLNPAQPCSDAIELTSAYQTLFREPTFFSRMNDQYYWFAQRTHQEGMAQQNGGR